MSSLFAAADDFADILEDTAKSKTHGTLGEIFNKDKSSEQQMNWEQKRLKTNAPEYSGGGGGGRRGGSSFSKSKGKKFGKKFDKKFDKKKQKNVGNKKKKY